MFLKNNKIDKNNKTEAFISVLKNPLWSIISMLIISFLLLSLYSFADYQIRVFNVNIEKTAINEVFQDTQKVIIVENKIQQNWTDSSKSEQETKPEIDSSAQKILLIGDSMLEGLMLRLKNYTAFNHHQIKTVIWYSSSTKWFGSCDTLSYFIRKHKPSFVMFVVGANELFVRNILERNQKYVEHILEQLDTTKYVWIGPPNWKDDTGINELIKRNVGEGQYYPSKNLTLARTKDGAHPTHKASAAWMDSVANWIMTQSAYPILLNTPDTIIKNSANVTILQPKR